MKFTREMKKENEVKMKEFANKILNIDERPKIDIMCNALILSLCCVAKKLPLLSDSKVVSDYEDQINIFANLCAISIKDNLMSERK